MRDSFLDQEQGHVIERHIEQRMRVRRLKSVNDRPYATYDGAVRRLRPKVMTAAVIIGGLLPILWSEGTGADVMKRIATPMVGGVITSTLMNLIAYPAIYFLWRSRELTLGHAPLPVGTTPAAPAG